MTMRYGVAALCVAVTLAVRLALRPVLELDAPLIVFTLAVLLAAYVGGVGPGLFATVLSAIAGAFVLLPPLYNLSIDLPHDRFRLLIFVIVGLGISLVCESLHRVRRRVELDREALAESEERFRRLFEHAPVGVAIVSLDGRILQVNQKACDIFGYTPQEIIGRRCDELTHPDDLETEHAGLRQLLDGRVSQASCEKRCIHRDGQPVWVSVASSLIDAPRGERLRLAVIEDITGRQRAADEVRRSVDAVRKANEELMFQKFALDQHAIVAVTDPAGTITYVNDRFCQISGFTEAELIGRNHRILNSGYHDAAFFREMYETIMRGEVWRGEIRNRTKDGAIYWVDTTIVPFRDAEGRIERYVAIRADITRLKQVEEQLRRRSQSLSLMSESATELLLAERPQAVIDAMLRRVAAHLAADVHLHYQVEEGGQVLCLTDASGVSEDVRHEITRVPLGTAVCGRVAQEGVRIVCENVDISDAAPSTLLKRMGLRSYACHPLIARGRVVGTLSFGSRSRATFLADELDLMVVVCDQIAMAMERERLLSELHERNTELSGANTAKDHFLAALSHELRTPLNPVLMSVSAMQRDVAIPEDVRDELEMIRRNVELEARLIDDLLDLTRVSRGKLELHHDVVDLHALVDHAIEACCRSEINQKRLDVDVRCDATRSHVWGDGARLQQVLWNLTKNAVKFTPSGGRIHVATHNDDDGRIVIDVRDSGIGIDTRALPRIFDAFEQGNRDVTRQFGGLGLGLAIAKAIVDLHHGTIEATSDGPGTGARFRVVLPTRAPSANGRASADGDGLHVNGAAQPDGNGRPTLRILLVEDHDSTAKVMARLLRAFHYHVDTAADIANAKRLADATPFDLVISDLGLPDGSGHDLMQYLRDRHQLPGIALSGYGMDEDVRKSREAGFAQHLTKPVNLTQLQSAVERLAQATRTA